MITASYKPRKKFMQLAIAEAKRARDRGDYPIGAVITRVKDGREVVIASAGNRVKTSGSSIKHVELETLKYVSSGYGRYLTEFVLYTTHEPCAMCAGACVWARIGAVVYGVSQEDIADYGRERGTEEYKWRACLIPCRLVFEKGNHAVPVIGGFLRDQCKNCSGTRSQSDYGIWHFALVNILMCHLCRGSRKMGNKIDGTSPRSDLPTAGTEFQFAVVPKAGAYQSSPPIIPPILSPPHVDLLGYLDSRPKT
jgi:tRNA(Arg) A34 adenosine deaminase TadA